MALIESILQELEQETQTTRCVLERVPDNHLTWRPHEKARTLGQLAIHVVTVPRAVAELAASPSPAQVPRFTDEPGNETVRPRRSASRIQTGERSLC